LDVVIEFGTHAEKMSPRLRIIVIAVLDVAALLVFLDRVAAASVCEANCGGVNNSLKVTLVGGLVLLVLTALIIVSAIRRRA
jgi:hypothetical protein